MQIHFSIFVKKNNVNIVLSEKTAFFNTFYKNKYTKGNKNQIVYNIKFHTDGL